MLPPRYSAPRATAPLDATLRLPGSKSLTNRELVLAALADGPGRLRAPLWSRDTELMIAALRSLGARIEPAEASGDFGPDLVVTPGELTGGANIDVGLAGTVMRFVPPLAALARGPVLFDGDEAARRRPMRTTIEALRSLGVAVDEWGTGRLPFAVHGTGSVRGGRLEIDASASSQFVSGLLLAAPRFEQGLRLRHTGARLPSMPHIEMTIATLQARGVAVQTLGPGEWHVPPQPIAALDVAIEPDLSNAAPFLAAPIVSGGRVTVAGWPASTTQVGAELERLLPRFGATVAREGDRLTVEGGDGIVRGAVPSGVDLDLGIGGELAPTFVGLAALCASPSVITGIGHLRGHETDRISALAANINALGGRVVEFDDGLSVAPAPLRGGLWRAHADHRMATTGALVGLAVPDVEIDDIASTSKTLPEFTRLWDRMLGR